MSLSIEILRSEFCTDILLPVSLFLITITFMALIGVRTTCASSGLGTLISGLSSSSGVVQTLVVMVQILVVAAGMFTCLGVLLLSPPAELHSQAWGPFHHM